ncbi:ergothioneine biosynthesis protein EgtB [Gracilimonas mengyeensis]|uniref:Ergothioneine biosynthesis protein EgtB n=1 Tax=Gracilimonas mengyeensis TaxID=1302730 RepID=A0A521FD51_9BACT|nr:ergothioneine biosynthesis protein EgtB [Gracilimonas mengyeensis]SMO94112.1 ergothioneine biosynthesis protein EgtB [Gracilimonas mengyeensis]
METVTAEETLNKKSNLPSRKELTKHFKTVRSFTEEITDPLEIEDYVIQVTESASPAKWHLAHTTWFFETFLLEKELEDYDPIHPQYSYLFNSYYLQTGVPHCRARRGNISRPTVKQVFEYRESINEHVINLIQNASEQQYEEWAPIIEIGIHHEQQHQELLMTDLKYMFAQNPLDISYKEVERPRVESVPELSWTSFEEGVYEVGHAGSDFGYDNEFPRHKTYIHDFELANRLVTNAEFIRFVESGAYGEPKWWLDEGFSTVRDDGWKAPLYWEKKDGEWYQFTLSGKQKVDPNEPVTHVSYFEADAYARWKGYRLPTEQEWEVAAEAVEISGPFADAGHLHPVALQSAKAGLKQMFGTVWQWTQSSYAPYPGYKPLPGALGEYNGKFMCNQYVLRGGSCATSKSHFRKTYRNFFHANERWQFNGIRLAK